MSVFTRRPYGRLAVVLNTLSSINIEIIICIIIIIITRRKWTGHIAQFRVTILISDALQRSPGDFANVSIVYDKKLSILVLNNYNKTIKQLNGLVSHLFL